MFQDATSFNRDISKWDVSSVLSMKNMFYGASAFNSDISKGDVARVNSMHGMFRNARSFNRDISKWDVSSVTNMNNMFQDAKSFKRKLCGRAWVHSRASKKLIFAGSAGSIPPAVCTTSKTTPKRPFSPQSKAE